MTRNLEDEKASLIEGQGAGEASRRPEGYEPTPPTTTASNSSKHASAPMPPKTRRLASFSLISVLALLFIIFGSDSFEDFEFLSDEFTWDAVTPSESLSYQPCFNGFQCAKLIVPLDYTNSSSSEKAVIAIATLPANIPDGEKSEEWAGPLLVNPGGPGGSGTMLSLMAAKQLQLITGRKYSIVGFDPRGVGETFPSAKCFKSEVERSTFQISESRVLAIAGDDVQGEFFARARGKAALCKQAPGMKHGHLMGTAFVARDMLRITEEAWKAVGKKPRGLNYWGFSYGSVLGATYATMFPDKVDHMVLDGVVNATDYMGGKWSRNLVDAEKGVDKFFEYCEAAPGVCALNTGNSTAAELRERVGALLKGLKHTPIPVYNDGQFQLVTYSYAIQFMFRILYEPLNYFSLLAEVLVGLESGDATILAKEMGERQGLPRTTCDPTSGNPRNEAGEAILCSDGGPVLETDKEYLEYYKFLRKQSPAGADFWVKIRANCLDWGFTAAERVTDFGAKTSTPILFIGNTRDPVTPLENAHGMSALFPTSEVLTQDSEGHCSTTAPSLCTINAIQTYFSEGKLPAPGTMCLPELKPFGLDSKPYATKVATREMEAMGKIAGALRKFMP